MSVKKTHWLRTTLVVLVICGITGLALTSYLFFSNPEPTAATATLEFTFQGAADGIAPNGATFTVADIASEDILAQALEENGLQDRYSVEQLRASLVAQGVYPDDLADQVMSYESLLNFTANRQTTVSDYHPTTFNIALYNSFDENIPRAQLESLLKSIVAAYKANFAKIYANGLQKSDTLFSREDYDYSQQLEILESNLDAMSGYAQEMYRRAPTFQLEGSGFNDISVRLGTLISSDISRLNATLTMNATSKDTQRLVAQYQFEIHSLGNQLEQQRKVLKRLDALIGSYEKNGIIYLSVGNTLTRIDGNSSQTYDALVDQRKGVADDIAQTNAQISSYELRISELSEAEGASVGDEEDGVAALPLPDDRAEALQASIDAVAAKGDAVIDDFQAMLQAYNAEEINDQTVTAIHYSYSTPTVLSGSFVRLAIQTAGPICALAFMVCLALIIRSRRREERQAQ